MVENTSPAGESPSDLIFFDTFSHDLHEKLNLDLVQFPSPVFISEIRIIPLGARVQADFPGGGNRLGATNPSQFDIEFFVNDLSVNVASTFELLGKFSYNQNECINLECKNDDEGIRKIPTDGLVLKGCYTTITLAVYGNIITYGNMPKIHIPGQANNTGNNNIVQVSSNDETNESDNGEVYNNFQHRNNDFQDQNSSCDPTVSSTIADDLKDDQPNCSPIDIYSRSPSKEQDLPKNKREWSNSPDGSYRHKRSRVSGSYDSSYDRRKPRSPPLQSPRISRPVDSDDDVKKDRNSETDSLPAAVGDLSTTFCPSSPSMNNNTPIESPTEMEEDPVELEPILSDEDISDDINGIDDDMFTEEFPTKTFNPFVDELRSVEKQLSEMDAARLSKVNEQLLSLSNSFEGALDSNKSKTELWIHMSEQIISSFHSLSNQEQVVKLVENLKESVHETFYSCIEIGLNYSLALKHQLPGYNLRHVKVGVRLVECLASCENFIGWLIDVKKYDLFQKLVDLLPRQLIPMPIKLLVARLIYRLIDTQVGIKKFLAFDGYKKVINMLSTIIDVRLLYTLKAILKKIHANETLNSIRTLTLEIYGKVKHNEEFPLEQVYELENLYTAFMDSHKLDVMQTKKFIPIATQFEIASGNTVGDFVSLYKMHFFVEIITLLWDVKHMLSPKLLLMIVEYLGVMAKKGNELEYISADIQKANDLVKMLIDVPLDTTDESGKLLNVEVGLEIAYKIEAKYHLDMILQTSDVIDLSEYLESLYCLCMGVGRKHVLDFIAMDENLTVFLNLIDKEKKISIAQGSPGLKQKSPVLSYSIDIVDLVVRNVEKLDYLRRYEAVLINLVKHHDAFEPSVAAMLQEMAVFLKPLEIERVFGYNDITPFVELINRSLEFLTTFPGDIIMTLRILRHLMIEKNIGEYQELKYDFYATQLNHADGAVTFLAILDKLTTHFDQPMLHSYLLGANQGNLLMHVVHPTVQILRKMLVQVIRSRNVNFKDVTAIETLMKTYTLMQSFHPRSSMFNEAKEVQREIIKILLTYTQSLTPDGMTTTNIHKSLWTQMIGEVIKYMLNGPYRFIPGLMVLSELLPLPLPVPIQNSELSKLESQRLITERQLWSAHLHPQSHLITEMIQTFCTSSTPDLYQMIYRVCVQLSDLAPNMTLLVTKSVVDMIIAEPLDKNNEGTVGMSKLLKFLATLVRHPCVKVSVLSILSGKLSERMSLLLNNVNDKNADHVLAQFHVFMILNNLFDCEISMLFNSSFNPELILASGLPTKELIKQFGTDAVECFCKTSAENLTFAAVRAMILLTEHDVTFNILRGILMAKRESFVDRLNAIAEKCKNERKQMVLIPDLLELFRSLINIEPNEMNTLVVPSRNLSLTISELSNILKWNSDEYKNGTKIHFLQVFSALVNEQKEDSEEDELVQSANLKSDLESMLEQLRDVQNNSVEAVVASSDPECTLAQAEGIVTQFSSRVAFYTTENIEDLTVDYWILNGCDEDETPDVVQCDLDELVRQCLPSDTNIGNDCKRLLALSSSPQSNRERNISGLCFRTRRVEVIDPVPGRPEKKIFGKFTPRGRGFSRAVAIRGDIFRSRPPNTSRPPSLHVDDFLAMESGQPSYNKREIISSSRGRGRGSSFISRGRGISSYNSSIRGHYNSFKPIFRGRSSRGIRGSRGYPR